MSQEDTFTPHSAWLLRNMTPWQLPSLDNFAHGLPGYTFSCVSCSLLRSSHPLSARSSFSVQPSDVGFKSFLTHSLSLMVPVTTRPTRIPTRTSQKRQTQGAPNPRLVLHSTLCPWTTTYPSPKLCSLCYHYLLKIMPLTSPADSSTCLPCHPKPSCHHLSPRPSQYLLDPPWQLSLCSNIGAFRHIIDLVTPLCIFLQWHSSWGSVQRPQCTLGGPA